MSDGGNAPRVYGAAPWERPIAEPASYPELDDSASPPTWTAPIAIRPPAGEPAPRQSATPANGQRRPAKRQPPAPPNGQPRPAARVRPARPAPLPPAPAPEPTSKPLSVAALLAREGAASKTHTRRHAKAEPEESEPALVPQPVDVVPPAKKAEPIDPSADWHTEIIAAVPPAAPQLDEYPDLEEIPESSAVDEHPEEPADLKPQKRAKPARVGKAKAGVVPVALAGERPKRTRRPVYFGRAVAAMVAICSLSVTGGAWQWNNAKNDRLRQVAALDPNSGDIRDRNGQYGDENFLIIGVDTRSGQNSEMGAGDTNDAGGTRSDTIMLVNIPANRKRVAVVSFPRDLAITPTLCETWNEDSRAYGPEKAYTETKLNSAFAYGGPKCLVKVIQKISGLSINRFLGVDFAGFSKIVDAVGGVEVCSTTPLKDYELGTVLENAGRQTIDGHTALQYVRARQVTTEYNGDYGRIKRQQLFLSSLLRAMISQNTFMSPAKLNNVVNTFIDDSYVDNIKTKDLVDLGQSLQNVKAGRITFLTIPTDGTDSEGNETPRPADIRKIFDAIINDDPLPGELQPDGTRVPMPGTTSQHTTLASSESETSELGQTSTGAPTPTDSPAPEQVELVSTEPSSITVHVSNSTGHTGLASTAAQQLAQYGFLISTKDDYPDQLANTTVFFSAGHEQQAATVAAAFGGARLQRVSGSLNTVRVVLGSDYTQTVEPPSPGSPVQLQLSSGHMASAELPMDLTVVNAADTTCE